jgi:ABC-type nitrate/sulfonate/bicarbonate transport system ATPase subunit
MTEKPLIEIVGLKKSFSQPDDSELSVLAGIDLTVEKNSLTTLIGPSGCGKSTFLNILTGLEAPTGGEIRFHPQGKKTVEFGYVFQAARLLPWMKVIDNVLFVHDNDRPTGETGTLARRYLEIVGLKDFMDVYPHQLSGGMQQRVGIARALSLEPDILLMDEPFSHLDEITAKRMRRDLIEIWKESKVTILFVTHDLSEAAVLSDRILFLTQKPAKIHEDVRIDIPRPRKLHDEEFLNLHARLTREFAYMEGDEDDLDVATAGSG